MKNILVVFPHLIYPLDSGGAQAIFNGIEAIRHHYNVYVVYFEGRKDHHPKERKKLEELLGNVTILPYFYTANKLHRMKALERFVESRLLRGMREWRNLCQSEFHMPMEGYVEFIHQVIRERHIDLVQLEMMESLPLALSIPEDVKKIFVHHELRFVRNELQLRAMTEANSFNYASVEMKRILEIGMLNRCHGVITLSETDRRKLQEAGVCVPVYTSFAVVQQRDAKNTEVKPHLLSFVGPEYHTPNSKGLLWFLDHCWPILKKSHPDYRLHVIGNWSEKTKKSFAARYADVYFLGFVDDLAVALAGSTMIVPILEGSGIRMKILEAALMNIPVVTTSVGCEGLPLRNGVSCVIADTSKDFVNGILSLSDDAYRKTIIQEAYQVINNQYSLEALSRNRLGIYQQLGI